MLSKCANPNCSTPFHYLRDGKLFQIDVNRPQLSAAGPRLVSKNKKLPCHIEYFWLCGPCSEAFTLAFQDGRGVVTLPRQRPATFAATAAAAAS